MRYIINSAFITVNRQSTLIENGMACNIRQFLAIQVKRQGLVSRNNNIFFSILYEFNGIAIRCLFNSICYRRIVGITIRCSCVNRARNTTTLSQSYLTRARSNIAWPEPKL